MDMMSSTMIMGLNSQLSAARFEINNYRIQNQTLNMKISSLMNEISTLRSQLNTKTHNEGMLMSRIRNYENLLAQNKIDYSKLQKENDVKSNNETNYEKLLEQPMHVIAHKHKKFRETWLKEQEFVANWMVSQSAFKELAIEFGEQLGFDQKTVIENGKNKKLGVLNNEFKEEHETNYNRLGIKEHVGEPDSQKIVESIKNRTISKK